MLNTSAEYFRRLPLKLFGFQWLFIVANVNDVTGVRLVLFIVAVADVFVVVFVVVVFVLLFTLVVVVAGRTPLVVMTQ